MMMMMIILGGNLSTLFPTFLQVTYGLVDEEFSHRMHMVMIECLALVAGWDDVDEKGIPGTRELDMAKSRAF